MLNGRRLMYGYSLLCYLYITQIQENGFLFCLDNIKTDKIQRNVDEEWEKLVKRCEEN